MHSTMKPFAAVRPPTLWAQATVESNVLMVVVPVCHPVPATSKTHVSHLVTIPGNGAATSSVALIEEYPWVLMLLQASPACESPMYHLFVPRRFITVIT